MTRSDKRQIFLSLVMAMLFVCAFLWLKGADAAMTQADLSSKLQTNISAVLHSPVDSAQLKAVCDAIALSVVQEIQSNAQVTVTVTGVSSGGSTAPGSGTVQ